MACGCSPAALSAVAMRAARASYSAHVRVDVAVRDRRVAPGSRPRPTPTPSPNASPSSGNIRQPCGRLAGWTRPTPVIAPSSSSAWRDYGDPRAIVDVSELSAMVSTNRVYRLTLEDGTHVIVKSSNYGSFFLFAEDHDRLYRANRLLDGGPFGRFLADVYTATASRTSGTTARCGRSSTRRSTPRIASREFSPIARSIGSAASWRASTRRASTSRSASRRRRRPPSPMPSTCSSRPRPRNAGDHFGLDRSRTDLVRRHTHRFLMAIHESGYDEWPKMPVLIDWNLGNFSVEFDGRRSRSVPPVQPVGLRLVPDRVAAARLLLPVARVVTNR